MISSIVLPELTSVGSLHQTYHFCISQCSVARKPMFLVVLCKIHWIPNIFYSSLFVEGLLWHLLPHIVVGVAQFLLSSPCYLLDVIFALAVFSSSISCDCKQTLPHYSSTLWFTNGFMISLMTSSSTLVLMFEVTKEGCRDQSIILEH